MKIAVYCGSACGTEPEYMSVARELGDWIGRSGHALVYGGSNTGLMGAVADAVPVPVIASGGAGKLEDFYDVLTEGGADAVLAASVFHYKTFTIKQVKEYLRSRGIEVRL